ncbi:MAG TPA: hypothetical protein VN999_04455, partial [Thermoanaerobaculia bacterium]|nr:hypothetical protein [Thermoanaerobaculia bacterium]
PRAGACRSGTSRLGICRHGTCLAGTSTSPPGLLGACHGGSPPPRHRRRPGTQRSRWSTPQRRSAGGAMAPQVGADRAASRPPWQRASGRRPVMASRPGCGR